MIFQLVRLWFWRATEILHPIGFEPVFDAVDARDDVDGSAVARPADGLVDGSGEWF